MLGLKILLPWFHHFWFISLNCRNKFNHIIFLKVWSRYIFRDKGTITTFAHHYNLPISNNPNEAVIILVRIDMLNVYCHQKLYIEVGSLQHYVAILEFHICKNGQNLVKPKYILPTTHQVHDVRSKGFLTNPHLCLKINQTLW